MADKVRTILRRSNLFHIGDCFGNGRMQGRMQFQYVASQRHEACIFESHFK